MEIDLKTQGSARSKMSFATKRMSWGSLLFMAHPHAQRVRPAESSEPSTSRKVRS